LFVWVCIPVVFSFSFESWVCISCAICVNITTGLGCSSVSGVTLEMIPVMVH
jgi:hypothetical protein